MFQEILLESSPAMRRRNPWPMATAFTLQLMIASLLILLPLATTGILPVSFHLSAPPRYTPIESVRPAPATATATHTGVSIPVHEVVPIVNLNPLLTSPFSTLHNRDTGNTGETSENPHFEFVKGGNPNGPSLDSNPVRPKPPGRVIISHLDAGLLLTKVQPEYPAIAKIAGVQGDVQLHAIIGKDGSIQSLSVTSGPAMLRESALKAVQQWKYRPYMLNGQSVEVETVITVSFKRL